MGGEKSPAEGMEYRHGRSAEWVWRKSRRCNRRITKDSEPHGREFSLHLLG